MGDAAIDEIPPETAPGGPSHASTGPPADRARWAAIAATALALVPILVVVVGRAGHRYLPLQDFAIVDLRVRDVWSGDLPLVGAYSRYGWNHPGPILFWLLAPLNRLFGGAPWTTLVGHAALQGVAVVGAAHAGWRRGRLPMVLAVLSVLLLTYLAIGQYLLFQPWNPHVALAFFPWFVLATWGLALGDRWDLLATALLGTFLVQTHLGYAPLVGAGVAVALVFAAMDLRSDRHAGGTGAWLRWRAPVLTSAALTALLWVPVVVEQLIHHPGNLRLLAGYFRDHTEPSAGLSTAVGWLATEYRVLPPWLGGTEPVERFSIAAIPVARAWVVVPVLLLATALVVAIRRRDRAGIRLSALVIAYNLAGLVALAGVTGLGFPYLFYWRVPLALLTILTTAYVVLRAVPTSWGATRRVARGAAWAVLAGTVVVGSLAFTRDVVDHPGLVDSLEPTVQAMLGPLARDAGSGTVLVRTADSALRGLHGGLLDALDREGVDVRVDPDAGFQFGDRTTTPDRADTVWYVAEDPAMVSELTRAPGGRTVTRASPLTPKEDRELTQLHLALADAAAAAGRTDLAHREGSVIVGLLFSGVPGVDDAMLARTQALNEKIARSGRCRCGVFAFDPADAPTDVQGPELLGRPGG